MINQSYINYQSKLRLSNSNLSVFLSTSNKSWKNIKNKSNFILDTSYLNRFIFNGSKILTLPNK